MSENINEGERILEDFLQKTSDNNGDSEETIVATRVSIERTVESSMAAASKKEKEVNALRRDLSAAKREIAALKETSAHQSSWRTQVDGDP
ncbi:uncharacterized protein LOC111134668 isoform X3 [Crassostrea virginica]